MQSLQGPLHVAAGTNRVRLELQQFIQYIWGVAQHADVQASLPRRRNIPIHVSVCLVCGTHADGAGSLGCTHMTFGVCYVCVRTYA